MHVELNAEFIISNNLSMKILQNVRQSELETSVQMCYDCEDKVTFFRFMLVIHTCVQTQVR